MEGQRRREDIAGQEISSEHEEEEKLGFLFLS